MDIENACAPCTEECQFLDDARECPAVRACKEVKAVRDA